MLLPRHPSENEGMAGVGEVDLKRQVQGAALLEMLAGVLLLSLSLAATLQVNGQSHRAAVERRVAEDFEDARQLVSVLFRERAVCKLALGGQTFSDNGLGGTLSKREIEVYQPGKAGEANFLLLPFGIGDFGLNLFYDAGQARCGLAANGGDPSNCIARLSLIQTGSSERRAQLASSNRMRTAQFDVRFKLVSDPSGNPTNEVEWCEGAPVVAAAPDPIPTASPISISQREGGNLVSLSLTTASEVAPEDFIRPKGLYSPVPRPLFQRAYGEDWHQGIFQGDLYAGLGPSTPVPEDRLRFFSVQNLCRDVSGPADRNSTDPNAWQGNPSNPTWVEAGGLCLCAGAMGFKANLPWISGPVAEGEGLPPGDAVWERCRNCDFGLAPEMGTVRSKVFPGEVLPRFACQCPRNSAGARVDTPALPGVAPDWRPLTAWSYVVSIPIHYRCGDDGAKTIRGMWSR